ncbi:MAG TPA: 1-(5-phosphoribosyl)-5-[(5-phosphoribosylamino)methylideneamino]imidazole-4-carboxamide isomerase [Kofleriaceae bacterium]|nr:1-(5-phosphoribosyl)-5-[(5-phosphoribosylamino)methylideneamino]imidazole-4-carboxamide isomerase [Kofleriaceae bacterium]
MIVIPAVDLMGGAAVRLVRGERDSAEVFSDRPWELIAAMCAEGAERLHLVDLDGAFAGRPVSRAAVERIVGEATAPVQVGGGLRDRAAVEAVLAAGARWAVLGTAAVRDPALVRELCAAFPERIIVAVDARDGWVVVEGWTEASTVRAEDLGRQAAAWGAAALLYTDVARDGTGGGPAVEATAALARAVPVPVIASGGIGSLDHVRALAGAGIAMAVVGRALLEKRFTLAEAVEAARC